MYRELGIGTLSKCENEQDEMLKLAQTMFDTKLPPGVTMLQPFSEGSSIKKISVEVLHYCLTDCLRRFSILTLFCFFPINVALYFSQKKFLKKFFLLCYLVVILKAFPEELFSVLRTVHLLRGLSVGMGMNFSCAEEWRPIAEEALYRAGRLEGSPQISVGGNATVCCLCRFSKMSYFALSKFTLNLLKH